MFSSLTLFAGHDSLQRKGFQINMIYRLHIYTYKATTS